MLAAAKSGAIRGHKCYLAEVTEAGKRSYETAVSAAEKGIRQLHRQAKIPQQGEVKRNFRKAGRVPDSAKVGFNDENIDHDEVDAEMRGGKPRTPLIYGVEHTDDWKDTEEFIDGIYNKGDSE